MCACTRCWTPKWLTVATIYKHIEWDRGILGTIHHDGKTQEAIDKCEHNINVLHEAERVERVKRREFARGIAEREGNGSTGTRYIPPYSVAATAASSVGDSWSTSQSSVLATDSGSSSSIRSRRTDSPNDSLRSPTPPSTPQTGKANPHRKQYSPSPAHPYSSSARKGTKA